MRLFYNSVIFGEILDHDKNVYYFFFFKHVMKKGNDHLIYFNTVMVLYFCIVEFSASNIQIDISRRRAKKEN